MTTHDLKRHDLSHYAWRGAGVAALALVLAGCGAGNQNFLVAPGKYHLYDCVQLGTAASSYVSREKTLREAMAKAEASPGGAVASALGYRAEYTQVQGNLDELRREATAKECNPPPAGLFAPLQPGPVAPPRR